MGPEHQDGRSQLQGDQTSIFFWNATRTVCCEVSTASRLLKGVVVISPLTQLPQGEAREDRKQCHTSPHLLRANFRIEPTADEIFERICRRNVTRPHGMNLTGWVTSCLSKTRKHLIESGSGRVENTTTLPRNSKGITDLPSAAGVGVSD